MVDGYEWTEVQEDTALVRIELLKLVLAVLADASLGDVIAGAKRLEAYVLGKDD